MKSKLLISLLLIGFITFEVHAQVIFSFIKDTSIIRSFDYTIDKTESDTYLKIFYEIPYGKLFYHKENEKFINRHQIIAKLYYKKDLLTEEIYNKEVVADNYEQTLALDKTHIDSIVINFPLKQFVSRALTLKIRLNDKISSRVYQLSWPIQIKEIYINLYKNRKINPSRTYFKSELQKETLGIKIHFIQSNSQNCSLFIGPKSKNQFLISEYFSSNHKNFDSLFHYLLCSTGIENNPVGEYLVEIETYDDHQHKLFSTNANFFIKGNIFEDNELYSELVNRLLYIATNKEMKKLKEIPPPKRESAWKAFWTNFNQQDYFRLTEQEYFTRINYCDEQFSHGDRGYRSDRAKIFMKYGEPDYIERQPFTINYHASEIWYYYSLGKKFIFIDTRGFGEYNLYGEEKI
jgi:GWxTD domain-containing protein